MYVPMKMILDDANEKYYAVPAINVVDMELARGVIGAAIEENSPLILNIGEGQMCKHGHSDVMVPMISHLAEKAPVPVALNLDHGKSWEHLTHAFRSGFSSIMIDASTYGLEENISRTAEVVRMCKPQGVTVEGELGHVGMASAGDYDSSELFTKPEDVVDFVERTGVDALAVAVGSAHGDYPKGFVPVLRFDLIRKIKEVSGIPLVLHGGSGSGDENLRMAVEAGINKVNICTDIWNSARDYFAETLDKEPGIDFLTLLIGYEKAVKKAATHFMRVLKSSGKASSFTVESVRVGKKEYVYVGAGE